MIRLSRLADYGVVLMTYIACSPAAPHSAHALAQATGIPLPTASKLLSALARAGIVAAVRGARGGFKLARRSEQITVADIIGAIDGPISLTQCIERGPGHCELEALCPSRTGWQVLNRSVRRAFEDVSLAHLLTPALMPGACVPQGSGPRAGAGGRLRVGNGRVSKGRERRAGFSCDDREMISSLVGGRYKYGFVTTSSRKPRRRV